MHFPAPQFDFETVMVLQLIGHLCLLEQLINLVYRHADLQTVAYQMCLLSEFGIKFQVIQ